MGNMLVKPSDRVALAGVIDPDANAAATYTTDWINMASFESLMAVVFAGTLGASATIDAKLQQATTAAGAGAKDVTGKAITQIATSDKQAVINLRAEELDVNNDFSFVRLSMTVGTAASDSGAAVFGLEPRYGPASNLAAASMIEAV
jgi:hypothetical protein